MKITRLQLRYLIKEMTDADQEDDAPDYLNKIKVFLDGDSSLESINQAHILAADAGVDMNSFKEIAYPAFAKEVASYSSVSPDDVKDFYEMGTRFGFELGKMKPIMSAAILKSVKNYSNPTLQDIKDLHDLAKSMNLDLKQIQDVVMGMIKRSSILEQVNIDNIIYEIDDILYRIRDVGLQSMGVQRMREIEDSGQLSEDEVNDTDMELVLSVKSAAVHALERSISQVLMRLFQ